MAEILDIVFARGVSLCCELGYVCGVLHLYNALRRLDPPIDEIRLFEQLCQLFREQLFLGTLPGENFSSHFRRAMGQGLDRENGSGPNSRPTLSKPTVVSKREIKSAQMSLFHLLVCSSYETTDELWTRVYLSPNIRQPDSVQVDRVVEEIG
ncbi:hypothetical protein BDV59DRAFT_137701 [Aspergillus ambiguus]|uniref:uncharacterized protein n=1 Tax=Aspergillus ambiguus TaxID=176160 RepID=UPI003CCD87E1